MTDQELGTVAALQFNARPPLDFPDVVEEFDIALQQGAVNQRRLTWDCDDVAIFDRGPVRIALGWLAPEIAGQPWYLIIAVGTSPEAPGARLDIKTCAAVTDRILDRASAYLTYDAVLRSEAEGPVDVALIDEVSEKLSGTAASFEAPLSDSVNARARAKAPGWYDHLLRAFRRDTEKPRAKARTTPRQAPTQMGLDEETEQMRRLREDLCGTTPETEITLPMHLTIYALGATMLLQAPPVGAALLVYTVLREEFSAPA